jgi:alpha-galactosidase
MRNAHGKSTGAIVCLLGIALLFSCSRLTDFSPTDTGNKKLPVSGLKVLVLGNSITLNAPDSSKGWYGNWGMAASAMDSDYVHILKQCLSDKIGYEPDVRIASITSFEKNFKGYDNIGSTEIGDLAAFGPDLVVLRIGDNVETADAIKYDLVSHYAALISFLKRSDSAIVVTTSCWFQKPTVDACMRMACEQQNVWFIDISDLYNSAGNRADAQHSYPDAGTGKHPGNAGMRAIADRLWTVVETLVQ